MIELRNWLLRFGCASEELRAVVARLSDWMANPPCPPWAAYSALMACLLVALDKGTGVRPTGIEETLLQALAKLAMRAAGDQAKTARGNHQLCAGLKAGIEGSIHAVVQRRLDRARKIRQDEEEIGDSEEEEKRRGVAGILNNLTIETGGDRGGSGRASRGSTWDGGGGDRREKGQGRG